MRGCAKEEVCVVMPPSWAVTLLAYFERGQNIVPHPHSWIAGVGRGIATGVSRCRRSEEHTSGLQSLMRISYAVFCLKKKKTMKHEYKIKTMQNSHVIQNLNYHEYRT